MLDDYFSLFVQKIRDFLHHTHVSGSEGYLIKEENVRFQFIELDLEKYVGTVNQKSTLVFRGP